MRTPFGAGVVAIVAVCLGLVPDPNPAFGQEADGPPKGENTITITAVDASKLGSANIGGTFTTKTGVTLTSVKGYAYPTAGGVVSQGGGNQTPAVNIDNTNKLFTSVIVADPPLSGQTYVFRVEGAFSDATTRQSKYFSATPSGGSPSNNVTVSWDAGFPKSTASKSISSQGSYSGNVNTTAAKFVYVTNSAGGPNEPTGNITLDAMAFTWKAADITASSGSTTYSALAIMNGNDGKTYCSPLGSVTTQP